MWNDMPEQDESTYNFGPPEEDVAIGKPAPQGVGAFREPILGMTPAQRLVVALFLLADVCVLGVLALIVFGKVYLL
jgi:hypothetical protein